MGSLKFFAAVLSSIFFFSGISFADIFTDSSPQTFYVNSKTGSDYSSGSIDQPFLSLEKALQVVDIRVNKGFYSDTIYLRAGVYKQYSSETLYILNLKGTAENRAVLSAMPGKPGEPNVVQMKSGKWYEKVVFDDSWQINTLWTKVPGFPDVWQTNPGFYMNEWPYNKMRWRYNGMEEPDDLKKINMHSLAPYMILQDGEPMLWADNISEIKSPGTRSYDFNSNTLFLKTLDDKDPNKCEIVSWYGGRDKNGYLLRDGEGRALFDGNLEYATICGFEFNMFTRIFEFHRRGYVAEEDRVFQHYFRFEDNVTRYCFINLLLDSNTTLADRRDDGLIPPRYNDRSNWEVRYNVFYRPTKECFQVHGDNHVFEYNEVIEHAGPWAGPASRVGVVNVRNMRNAQIRYNYILGHGPNPDPLGSVFMIEASGSSHSDENGDYLFGGVCYEYNIFANISMGTAIYAGKGGIRMKNITIRNNIFTSAGRDPAIKLSSPHMNLIIENNIFYKQMDPIKIEVPEKSKMEFDAKPSSITIRNNIFAQCKNTIDPVIYTAHKDSKIIIEENLFYRNEQTGTGKNQAKGDPKFTDPEALDFSFAKNSFATKMNKLPGIYNIDGQIQNGADWKTIRMEQLRKFPDQSINAFKN